MEHVINRAEYRRGASRSTTRESKTEKKPVKVSIFIIQAVISIILIVAFGVIKLLNIEVALGWIKAEMQKGISALELKQHVETKFGELFKVENTDIIEENNIEENSGAPEDVEPATSISTTVSTEPVYESAVEGVNQLCDDAEYIKSKYSMIHPIIAPVSSWFGVRESTNPIVTSYHSGIDLVADTGTKIKAALSGEVVRATTDSAYGKYIMIKTDDVNIIYAHCSKLNVKVGQKIKQGDYIGEVGSTGLSTGPHLHFEIRLDGRIVNPANILKFSE